MGEIIPDEEGIDLLSHARLFRSLQWKIPGSKKSLKRKPCFPSIYRSKCPETSHDTHVSFSRLFCGTRDWFEQIVKRDFRAKFLFTTCPYVFWADRFAYKCNRYTTVANGHFCNSVHTHKKEPNRRYIYLYEIIHPVLNLVLTCAFTGVQYGKRLLVAEMLQENKPTNKKDNNNNKNNNS